jgi:hypothetical protein
VVEVPVTVAVNCLVWPSTTVAVVGETVIPTFCVICTDALADLVESATDVAVTVTKGGLGAADGAVYSPLVEMVPHNDPVQPVPLRLHVTLVFAVPVTVAVNCCFPPTPTDVLLGDTDTETLFEVIVTVVEPVIDELESEVAVTVTTLGLGAEDGAV